jgi:hypothetical protein
MTKTSVLGVLIAAAVVIVAAFVILRAGATHAPAVPAAVGFSGAETGQVDREPTRITHHPIVVMPGDSLSGPTSVPYSPAHSENWPASPAGKVDESSLPSGGLPRPYFVPDPSRLDAEPRGIELSPAMEWPDGRRPAPAGIGKYPIQPAPPLPFRAEAERRPSPASLPRALPR